MRTTSAQTQAVWQSGDFVGGNRPIVRATIQRLSLYKRSFGSQVYTSVPFAQKSKPLELPNIKSVKWSRSVDGGVATCTLTLYNTEPLPLGASPAADLDRPGYFTYQRGKAFYSPRWHHTKTGWQDWIVPDRIIRTFEGYGFDPDVPPELDTHLYQSGTWLIDDVELDHEGYITIECRDIGRVLLDQIMLPPVVPTASYPLYFDTYQQVNNPDIVTTTGTGWHKPAYDTSSNAPYIGVGGAVQGHVGTDAFDSSTSSYWLSIGNAAPDAGYSFEYIQGKFASQSLSAVRVRTWGGPYRAYISVYAGGKWQGKRTVPYDPNNPVSAPNGANIPYVYAFDADRESSTSYSLPKPIEGATKVRVSFTNLTNSGIGPYKYRAGVRTLEISSQTTTTKDGGTHTEPKTSPPGYGDFTDIVKILLAYGGFFWPSDAAAFIKLSDGTLVTTPAATNDPALRGGRVWGDFEQTGTAGVAPLGVDVWDKKPLMDGINYVRDMVGFIFYVDELGGAVFRSPNIWSVGNYIGLGAAEAGRTTDFVIIDETQTLMGLGAKLSSRSIRERIFVGNLAGQVAGMSAGHNPYPSGLRRVGGWTDQSFKTAKECKIMADLIGLRQLFTYRTDKVKIPGNPAIQIDDQVKIFERITEEGYLHYVESISMEWNAEDGRYTYDLGTHWLGATPFSDWTFDPATLSAETVAYLKALGKVP